MLTLTSVSVILNSHHLGMSGEQFMVIGLLFVFVGFFLCVFFLFVLFFKL